MITFDGCVIRASGWRGAAPSDWADVFVARVSDDPGAPAVLGSYAREGDEVVFTPRFAPAAGLTLNVRFDDERASFVVAAGAIAAPSTRVSAIYPSGDVWPANALKFYVHFSAPMRIGDAWQRIRFRDDAEAVVEGAFVEIDQELWDREGRRLTVLFDPGRIKRGLIDNIEEGAPLIEGRRYTLEIDGGWRDARGATLIEGVRKTILVGSEYREAVMPSAWRVAAPAFASDTLLIEFPRAMDHPVTLNATRVERDAARVAGDARLEDGETRFVFTPDTPWRRGDYEIVVDRRIEDVAGNKLGRLFDVDTSDPTQTKPQPAEARLHFSVG